MMAIRLYESAIVLVTKFQMMIAAAWSYLYLALRTNMVFVAAWLLVLLYLAYNLHEISTSPSIMHVACCLIATRI